MNDPIRAELHARLGPITGTLTAALRTNLSFVHLASAAQFSAAAGRIEAENAGAGWGAFYEDIIANASACVLLSIASLEAFANELFIDHGRYLPAVAEELVGQLWEDYERAQILAKIDIVLLLAGGPRLNRGSAPVQDVDAAIRLRNALTHFKAEWSNEADEHARLSGRLEGRFAPSPFLPGSELLFPRRWAGHGCTQWTVASVAALIQQIENALGVESRFASLVSRIRA